MRDAVQWSRFALWLRFALAEHARTWLGALLIIACAGCSSPKAPPTSLPEMPTAFKEADPRWVAVVPADAQPRGEWWKAFGDPVLSEILVGASDASTGIQAAAARLAKARSLVRTADANRKPQASLAAGLDRIGGPLINAAGGSGLLYTLAAGVSYEADLFGRLAGEVNAASLDAESHEALLQSTRLAVHADIAQAYFELRMLDIERRVVRETLQAHRQALHLTQRRFELGSVAELDVARMQTDVAATEAEGLVLDRRRVQLEHAIALLAGKVASTFRIAELYDIGALPRIPPGLPSTLLARRPDIAAAQRTVLAAQARLGVAQTAWLPNVNLNASQGFAASDLGGLLAMSARAYGIGALLALPLFDGGRREAAIEGARADLELEASNYRERILVALREVEDQLSSLRVLADHERVQSVAASSATRAREIARSRYEGGLGSQLDLLDAQRTELRHQRQVVQVRSLQFQATVGLVRALGGGWEALPKEISRAKDATIGAAYADPVRTSDHDGQILHPTPHV